jgi:L-ascorbate metabolism protein UlaG (beta-lactamase superfamily)
MVVVKWLGHACFEFKNNVCIVSDPHGGRDIGLTAPKSEADIVLISHGHYDHKEGEKLVKKPDAKVVDKPGSFEIKGVKIKGISTFHDKSQGRERGGNIIFVFELDGVKFCHLGDLGHILSEDQVREIGQIDVLLVPVGGTFTVNAKEATQIVEMLKPKVVVPMHYKVRGLNLPISSVDEFVKGKSEVKQISGPEFTITKESLPQRTQVNILSL